MIPLLPAGRWLPSRRDGSGDRLRVALLFLALLLPAWPSSAQEAGWTERSPAAASDGEGAGEAEESARPRARTVADRLEAVGLAPWLDARLESVILRAIEEGASPGVALVVGRRGQVVISRGYGWMDWHRGARPVTDSTLYDLASLTKVVATTTAAMILVEEGRLDLDRPIREYLPMWPDGDFRDRITARHLLTHTSGLPAGARLRRQQDGWYDFVLSIASVPLRSIPGTVEHYSDLGMILLGRVVEEASGERLDDFLERRVFAPLGMSRTLFQPRRHGVDPREIAPTEVVGGELLHGVVHDPNAWAMGGVAGHAGLFSTARDLATFASALLWESPEGVTCRAVVRRFTRQESRDYRFAMGWETPWRWTGWGDYFGPHAIGHTGYTGTGMWIDPEQDLFIVLLTNRVNPTARNRKHLELRRDVWDAVQDALVELGPAGGWLEDDPWDLEEEGACGPDVPAEERYRRLLPGAASAVSRASD